MSTLLAVSTASNAQADNRAICGDCVIERVATCPGFLEGINVDEMHNIWLVDVLGGAVIRVPSDGRCHIEANTGGNPNGAKLTSDGKLLIVDKALGLMQFDPRSRKLKLLTRGIGRENFRGLNDLYPDGAGGFYLTEPYGSDTLKPTGRVFHVVLGDQPTVTLFAEGIAFPNGVAVSRDGQRVFVAEFARKQILALPSRRSTIINPLAIVFARTEGGIGPDGLVVDSDDRLFAAGYGDGSISVFDRDGNHIGKIALPPEAGKMVTNFALSGGYLYFTEASKGSVWRVKLSYTAAGNP